MLYIIHLDDGSGQWGWVHVLPKKSEAMLFAEDYAAGDKHVVYLTHRSRKSYTDYDATKTVVVCQATNYYNGA